MLKYQEIQLAQSKRREKMAALQNTEGDLTDEQVTELRSLTGAYETAEVQFRAALLTEDAERATIKVDDKAEADFDRECRQFSLSRVVAAAEAGRPLDGRELEVSQELEKRNGAPRQGGVMVPWEALLERRADAVITTSVDDDLVSRPVRTPLERFFASSAAARFGFDTIQVTGRPSFPEITAGAHAHWLGEGQCVDAEGIDTTTITPTMRTVAARYLFTKQAVRENPSLEDVLRRDLGNLIRAEIDRVAFQGQGGLEPVGLLKRLADAGRVTAVDARASFGALLAAAVSIMESAKLSGPDAVKIAGAPVLLETMADDLVPGTAVSAWDRVKSTLGVPILSPPISLTAPRDAEGMGASTVVVGAPEGVAHILMWGGIEIVTDPYSEAKCGKVALTAFAFTDVVIQRVATHFLALTGVQDRGVIHGTAGNLARRGP